MSWTLLIKIITVPVLALCATVPQLPGTYDPWQGPVVFPALSSSENSSAATGNTSLGNILKLRCDSVRYGSHLKVESCRKVFNFIAQDDTQTIFAERDSVQPHDLNLPFRAYSSEYLSVSDLLHFNII